MKYYASIDNWDIKKVLIGISETKLELHGVPW